MIDIDVFSPAPRKKGENESHMTADILWRQLSKAAGFPNLREGESAVQK